MDRNALRILGIVALVAIAVLLIGHHEHVRIRRAADTAPIPPASAPHVGGAAVRAP